MELETISANLTSRLVNSSGTAEQYKQEIDTARGAIATLNALVDPYHVETLIENHNLLELEDDTKQ